MEKTSRELGEKLIGLLEDIKKANSSFEVANLSQQALEVTKEWKKAKELEEAQKSKPESKPEPKKFFGDIKFRIPPSVLLISEESGSIKERFIRFSCTNTLANNGYDYVGKFCIEILKNLFETTPEAKTREIEESIIKILEEKFGLTIKICGNCQSYYYYHDGSCDQLGGSINRQRRLGDFCCLSPSKWIPKEIPEEKK